MNKNREPSNKNVHNTHTLANRANELNARKHTLMLAMFMLL